MPSDAGNVARRALLDDGRPEEAITVNQRALIDKILARYAAEFTVFRELLQNADDAGATNCELRFESVKSIPSSDLNGSSPFESVPTLPDFKATLQNWVFRNDGKPFGDDDWSRLRRIAEGNPDPDRIGAFGVGFYSLFSICEEPIVSSGDELMGFFWKGDALFTRRAKSSKPEISPARVPWTSFFMALREPAPFPESLMALCRFLATSLTFTTKVRSVGLYFDDQLLCKLEKKLSLPKPLPMPGHLNSYSPAKIMRVKDLESTAVQIDVSAMRLVIEAAEKEKPKSRQALTASLAKSAGGSLTSMLQSAFGRSVKKEEPKASLTGSSIPQPAERALGSVASLLTSISASIHLRIATANISVSTDKAFDREIERSTKKPPPKTTAFHIIFTGKDEYDASFPKDEQGVSSLQSGVRQIFQGLMPRLEDQGHTFIGFRTHQTSSFSGHIAARFIPTVERESLDFIDKYCAKWNSELLSMGGYIARAVYENELQEVGRLWNGMIGTARPADDNKDAQWLKDRALHTMRFFTFRNSSPSSRVHSIFESSFFTSARQATITLMSTRGVKHSAAVRVPNDLLSGFVKDLATIPPYHIDEAADFIREVRARNLVHDITMDDVFKELSSRPLDPKEMVACLSWWISVANHPSYDISLRSRLLESALLSVPTSEGSTESTMQSLASIQFFLNPQRVPSDVPLPHSCLSYEVSKSLNASDLANVFGWVELPITEWLKHTIRLSSSTTDGEKSLPLETNLQLSPAFSEKVLGIVARAWGSLPAQKHAEISEVLKNIPCIPTRKGMQKPGDAYFSNVSLFPDLPILEFPTAQVKGNLEKVLVALSVRRHVELQMIFDRLVAAGDWSHVDLVGYLASNKESLSSLEKERLTKTAIFPKYGEVGPPGKDGKPKIIRYRASDLYEPLDVFKALKLATIDWPGKAWRSTSDEAKFVFELGLRRHPPLQEILALASSTHDADLRSKALAYFFDKFNNVYRSEYSLNKAASHAFVPCKVGSSEKIELVAPIQAFTNPEARIMGFAVVAPEIPLTDLPKLHLRSNPLTKDLIATLLHQPEGDEEKARKIFEYLASISEFSPYDYSLLKNAEFIPVKKKPMASDAMSGTEAKVEDKVTFVSPSECYFGGDSASSKFKDVFVYCDFGPLAGTFLRNCGVTDEPSIEEVATKLVREPQRFYQLAGSTDAYFGILRQIATNWERIKAPLRAEMKRSPFLLGSKRINQKKMSEASAGKVVNIMDEDDDEEMEDAGSLIYDLKRPAEIVIVDDANSHMLFASSVFFAPHEDLLQEGLYEQLGSPRLSTLVEEKYSADGRLLDTTRRSEEVKALVLERTPLFLFEKRSTSRSEIRYDGEWLKKSLEVVEVDGEGLRLTRTLTFGSLRETNVQRSSAMATMRGKKLTLFLSAKLEVDYFEVATALNKYLLTRQRLQEVLLYMTLLSTSLRNLKRRGFHVDKILSQRKAERELFEARQREERIKAELEATKPKPSDDDYRNWNKQVSAVFPDVDPAHVDQLLRSFEDNQVERATEEMLRNPYPKRPPNQSITATGTGSLAQAATGGGGSGFFSSWKNRFTQSQRPSSLADGTSSIERGPPVPGGWGEQQAIAAAGRSSGFEDTKLGGGRGQAGMDGVGMMADGAGPLRKHGVDSSPPDPNAQVTPQSTIQNNVLKAIQASRGGDNASVIRTQAQQTQIKEASNSYCDTTGVATDLRLAGEINGMKVYLNPSLDPVTTLSDNSPALERLIERVFKPVGNIFGLDPKCMNVFCDTKGPTIAFNRGGSIYLNFRYYLAWHDELVKQGKMADPLVSTYFSVAHEIAHNVVEAHNAEHEWYFSAIAEKYIVSLASYISLVDGK
ncbi:hypothetical protein IE53DRAFT_392097 [Violaceomyces palustris]|uniref:Uncharacterized protein n=1 Tax=Violaceomyces palustris TaxID=1673888 RepID=A0ACD0P7T6_9BASI|nr:hypothetical protein IE53DRAFT_392097 [Violaceomyces palustris]